jgi:purine nucleosidase
VPVRIGAKKPLVIPYQLGDDAFGSDGLGGVPFMDAGGAVDEYGVPWIVEMLESAPAPLTLAVTGPATNVALVLRYPAIKEKISQIVIMGGGVTIGGNIKPYAEFNFYMDPDAADAVLKSGVPVVLHTLDTTQQTYYSADRQQRIEALTPGPLAARLSAVMRITEALEMKNFGVPGAFFHDAHVAAYMAMPDNYQTRRVRAEVLCAPAPEAGRLIVEDDPEGSVLLATRLVDDERFFSFLYEGLKRILDQYPE